MMPCSSSSSPPHRTSSIDLSTEGTLSQSKKCTTEATFLE
uniref:Uncharacterized protein n=1 Tax=Arundo donax TaxID=35708 RepID=A0A0A9CBQ9_ARUDO